MNYQNEYDFSIGNCPAPAIQCRKVPWYCKFIKPFFSFVVSVLLALSMSHLCEKYSASNSLQVIKSDLSTLRNNINSLSSDVRELAESRDKLRNKLKEVACLMPKLSEAFVQLKEDISKEIETNTNKLLEVLTSETLRQIIRSEILTYDADKIGKTDYALESSGGQILSTRDTETYTSGLPGSELWGVPLCKRKNTPRSIIQKDTLPGECWSFKGSQGSIVIKLAGLIQIQGVSLEHILPKISLSGETSTAPKEFSIWGLKEVEDKNGVLLGRYVYNNAGSPIQYFDVQNREKNAYDIVELKIHSNSGNSNFTCVYRVRVHGTPMSLIEMVN